MKPNILFGIALCALISACASPAGEEIQRELKELQNQNAQQNDLPKLESIDMELLDGIWLYEGVGTDAISEPIRPIGGDIYVQFTKDGNMAGATEGLGELAQNIESIPSPFDVSGNKMCSDDIVFKLQFKAECAEVIVLNEDQLVIGYSSRDDMPMMYKFYSRYNE